MSEPSVRRAGERSPPSREYAGEPVSLSQSLRLIEVAATLTSTCPAAGDGVGTSSTRSTSGRPVAVVDGRPHGSADGRG